MGKRSNCGETLLSFDRFAEKVPSFNFRSKSMMGSWFGLLTSLVFWMCLIAFGVVKTIRLVKGSNPLISAATELDLYGEDDVIDLDTIQMLGAFQVTDFMS